MSPRIKRLTASEVGEYTYCARAWWYDKIKKLDSANLVDIVDGISAHEHHGWQVTLSTHMRRVSFIFFAFASLFLLIVVGMWLWA